MSYHQDWWLSMSQSQRVAALLAWKPVSGIKQVKLTEAELWYQWQNVSEKNKQMLLRRAKTALRLLAKP